MVSQPVSNTPTHKHQVLLVCLQPLLSEGLEYILNRSQDIDLDCPKITGEQVLDYLEHTHPNLVLLAGERDDEESTSLITRLVHLHPDLPILWVGLVSNNIRIYTSHTLPARSTDLIEAIRQLATQPKP